MKNKLKTMLEKLWAKNKYDIMARNYRHYKEIGSAFKTANAAGDYEDIYANILRLRELPYEKTAVYNTLQHIWGYFKNKATDAEKELCFQKLEACKKEAPATFHDFPPYVEETIGLFRQWLTHYPNDYLAESVFLFPEQPWNVISVKKKPVTVDESFLNKIRREADKI